MPPTKSDDGYLWDMLDAARSVSEFVAGRSFDQYLADKLLRSAVERQIEIIGEAARHVSDGTQGSHPEIPWRLISAQRQVLAHDMGKSNTIASGEWRRFTFRN
jgi:uncharacterized protein with HEPN domain